MGFLTFDWLYSHNQTHWWTVIIDWIKWNFLKSDQWAVNSHRYAVNRSRWTVKWHLNGVDFLHLSLNCHGKNHELLHANSHSMEKPVKSHEWTVNSEQWPVRSHRWQLNVGVDFCALPSWPAIIEHWLSARAFALPPVKVQCTHTNTHTLTHIHIWITYVKRQTRPPAVQFRSTSFAIFHEIPARNAAINARQYVSN